MSDRDEYDWIFDYALQFLESDTFDASVMNFIDEKCDVFDCEEENKFIYTDIHNEFREHVEALIASNLGELGITTELFFESCERSRHKRNINKTVFERLTAIDDFQTLKKVMVRRNVELQIEAMQQYANEEEMEDDDEEGDLTPSEQRRISKEMKHKMLSEENMSDDEKIQLALQQSMFELEILHRQIELENSELEQVLALSLAIEEDRLRSLYNSSDKEKDNNTLNANYSEAKQSFADSKTEFFNMAPSSKFSMDSKEVKASSTPTNRVALADPKQLPSLGKVNNCLKSTALPPISQNNTDNNNTSVPIELINALEDELDNKKQIVYESLKESKNQIIQQQKLETEIFSQMTKEEAEKRAKFMKEQRDKLIAMKKSERDKKVKVENEKNKMESGKKSIMERNVEDAVHRLQNNENDSKSSEIENEKKRNDIRLALAKRMKIDLIQNPINTGSESKDSQFSLLDQKLKEVETARKGYREKEMLISEQIKKQMIMAKGLTGKA